VLYLLTRMGGARDWGTGLALKANLLGKMNRLEVHHIFPKAQLYKRKFKKPEVNALANFCFLTKDTNIDISDRLPEEYFPEVEAGHPGALASQWVPTDPQLWKLENYRDFLEARKELLAERLPLWASPRGGGRNLRHGTPRIVGLSDQSLRGRCPQAAPRGHLGDLFARACPLTASDGNILASGQ
jgi:hypothetical protein